MGTPDVNFIEGWMELKHLAGLPKRGGPIRVAHFTKQQRVWLMSRYERGGNVWMCVRIGTGKRAVWMLMDGMTAGKHLGHSTMDELTHHGVILCSGPDIVAQVLASNNRSTWTAGASVLPLAA